MVYPLVRYQCRSFSCILFVVAACSSRSNLHFHRYTTTRTQSNKNNVTLQHQLTPPYPPLGGFRTQHVRFCLVRGGVRNKIERLLVPSLPARPVVLFEQKSDSGRDFNVYRNNIMITNSLCSFRDELAELRLSHMESKKHKGACPAVTTTSNVPSSQPGLTFAGGIVSGGIIFNANRVGVGVVQPNQSVGVVQPSKSNLVGSKTAEGMGSIQPVQTNLGLRMVHTSQPSLLLEQKVAVTSVEQGVTENSPETMQVDLDRVKPDQDEPKSPDGTEFVDMDNVVVKNEPIEEVEFTDDYNFLSEECPSGKDPSRAAAECGESEANAMFMKSCVAHMRRLTPYDQSVFKLKVQQLLHDMMFPAEARN